MNFFPFPLIQKNCPWIIILKSWEPGPYLKFEFISPLIFDDYDSRSGAPALRWWLFIHRPISLLAEVAPSPVILINCRSNWLIKSCLQKPKWLTDSLNYDTYSGCKMADCNPISLTFMGTIMGFYSSPFFSSNFMLSTWGDSFLCRTSHLHISKSWNLSDLKEIIVYISIKTLLFCLSHRFIYEKRSLYYALLYWFLWETILVQKTWCVTCFCCVKTISTLN